MSEYSDGSTYRQPLFTLMAEETMEAKIRNLLTPIVNLAKLLEIDGTKLLQSQLREQVLNNCARLIRLGEECDKRFTFTAEEVDVARKLINKGMDKLGHEIKQNRIKPSGNSWINNFDKKEPLFRDGKNLLTKIKEWQDNK